MKKTTQETQIPPKKRAHRRNDAMLTIRLSATEKLQLLALSRLAGQRGNYSAGARLAIATATQTAKTPATGRA